MIDNKWNMIPIQYEYNGKIYRILNIDLQGGYFTLHDSITCYNFKTGEDAQGSIR